MSTTDPAMPITDHEPTEVLAPTPPAPEMPDEARPQRVRVGYLVMGLLFLGCAGLWLLITKGVLTAADFTLAGPIILIIAGSVGLLASILNRAKGSDPGDGNP